MYNTWIKNDNNPVSSWGTGSTEKKSLENAKTAYIEKYPEEVDNVDNIEWDTVEQDQL